MHPLARLAAVARYVDAGFLVLLAGVYVLAAVLPAPARLVSPAGGLRTAQVVLAALLFIAGLRTAVPSDPREVLRRGALIGMGVLGRLVPLVVMLVGVPTLALGGMNSSVAADVATGLVMVAAMPTANTSTAWTRRSTGDLTVCAGVVVATTLLAPLVIPATLTLVGGSAGCDRVSGDTFVDVGLGVVGWVVVPIVTGIVVGRVSGLAAGTPLGPVGSLGTLAALLLLNYLNASQALPNVLEGGGAGPLAWAALGAMALVPLSYAVGRAAGWLVAASRPQGTALAYAVGMGNTGLASTLAITAFPGRPATLYPIVLCTLLQHAVAAAVHERQRAARDVRPPVEGG